MGFRVRYRRRARGELDQCISQLGPEFETAVREWLEELADEAERHGDDLSSDAKAFLEQIGQMKTPKVGFPRWLEEGIREKLLALLVVLSERCPPWEYRMAARVFLIPNTRSSMPSESPGVVTVLYETNRVDRSIIITIFPDLP